MAESSSNNNIVKAYLPLALAIIAAAITWGVFTEKLSYIDARLTSLETKVEKNTTDFSALDKRLERIQTILEERLPAKK